MLGGVNSVKPPLMFHFMEERGKTQSIPLGNLSVVWIFVLYPELFYQVCMHTYMYINHSLFFLKSEEHKWKAGVTLASKACLKISHRVLAYTWDFPVSVAYSMVDFTLFAMAWPMSLAENFTALWMWCGLLVGGGGTGKSSSVPLLGPFMDTITS